MGIVAVKNALQELDTYVIRERMRDSGGRFIVRSLQMNYKAL
jgi:hypothetical protein